jgi:hypothetical protein
MEMHDSFLKEWACDEQGRGYALFHACIHRAEGEIFDGPGHESGWQGVRFDFEGMSIDGLVDFSEDTYLSDGDLWIDENHEANIVYLPANHAGQIRMEMCVAPVFDTVKIRAAKITSQLVGEFEHESFWDENGPIGGS